MSDIDIILGDSAEVNHWLMLILDDLLNNDYKVCDDKDTAIKIAVLRHAAERKWVLEQTLTAIDDWRDELNKIVASVL